MKNIDLKSSMIDIGSIPNRTSLDQIIEDVRQTKHSINPYTITAQKIMAELHRQFLFPLLQPRVVNPFAVGGIEELPDYYSDDDKGTTDHPYFLRTDDEEMDKFYKPLLRRNFGMDKPWGLELCVDDYDLPFFIKESELLSEPGVIDYRVHDERSFMDFIKKIVEDMSFLKPMSKVELNRRYNYHNTIGEELKIGDVVVIPDQNYGKLGVVTEIEDKEYLAMFFHKCNMFTRYIGVNKDNLVAEENLPDRIRITYDFEGMDKQWLSEDRIEGVGKLPLGTSALFGRTLGWLTLTAYDERCAVVKPYPVDKDEYLPWGPINKLPIPISNLRFVESYQNIKTGVDATEFLFFADDEVKEIVQQIAEKEILDPNVKASAAFTQFMRYKSVLDDLKKCSEVPAELVAPQFIKILTHEGVDGVEILSKISGQDVSEIVEEILAADVKHAYDELDNGRRVYASFLEDVSDLLFSVTNFSSIEDLLAFAGPKINLYQMPRDGRYTIAFITGLDMISSDYVDGYHTPDHLKFGRDNEDIESRTFKLESSKVKKIIDQVCNSWYKGLKRFSCWASFLDKDIISDANVLVDDFSHAHPILRVKYKIIHKNNDIVYGLDKGRDLTSPGLMDIDTRFKMHEICTDFEYKFLIEVFDQIENKMEYGQPSVHFKGKGKFFRGLEKLKKGVRERAKENETRTRWLREEDPNQNLVREIRPLYNGVRGLTNDIKVRDKLVIDILGDKPLLLEAFYDFHYMQKVLMIRDHYFRDSRGATAYLRNMGFPISINSSEFEEGIYTALVYHDMDHRGLNREEIYDLTKQYNSEFTSSFSETESSVGLMPSLLADKMIERISEKAQMLAERTTKQREVKGLLYQGDR